MNKKGFTLIELLGVVTLIVLISLIVIPNLLSSINKKRGEISSANMQLLASAANVYIDNHPGMYSNSFEANGSTYCIAVQSLINDGILETPFKDANGNEIDYSDMVKATYNASYNGFDYEFVRKNACTEVIQYVSRPELADGMIPVVYDDGSWKKADLNSKWYNYSDKKWANAVLVREWKSVDTGSKSRYEYLESPAGTPILETDILAYFVWIPRFRYQLFSSNSVTPINIAFESISTSKSQGTAPGQWLTHPAFTYNNHELSGIWVGKYEASNSNDSIIVKSGTAWTNIDYVSANDKILSMTNQNNIYGLKGVNTHMVRNSEWGALAYLTNSIYGNLSDNSSTGNNTGIHNLSGNKEFIIMDNENQYSLGYSLSETNNWSNDNSFPTSENLYLTRGANSIFNYQNSKVIDPNTTFRVALVNTDVQNQDYERKYVVTFDPNGGTLSETTKEVSYHEAYGELPIPTKAGYTFMGWNGKNIVDKSKSGVSEIANEGSNSYWATTIFNNYWVINNLKPDTRYSVSYDIEGITVPEYDSKYSGNLGLLLYSQNSDHTTYPSKYMMNGNGHYISVGEKYHYETSITTTSNVNLSASKYVIYAYSNRFLKDGAGVYSSVVIYNIQMEEGDTATEFEPYYITPSTTVVQDKDHTLKAIWEANS